jgi:hypothetical protein
MDFIVKQMENMEEMYKVGAVYNMKTLGDISVDALVKHRPMLEEMTKNASLKDSAEHCINLIEGRRYECCLGLHS